MARPTPQWLDEQYDNRARVPEHAQIISRWQEASALAREGSSRRLDLRYGSGPNETLDLFPTPQANAPVLVFIHGGYWRALDKADFSFVAPVFAQAGAMVVVPNYGLCPAVSIETIALQMVKALAWTVNHAALYGGDASRIVVAGHSAGGHLAAMMLSCDWRAVGLKKPAVKSALSLSGLYDLAPLSRASFLKDDLRLTPKSVQRLSPAGFPAPKGQLYAVVGGDESEEFQRQNQLIQQCWGRRAVPLCEAIPGANHFTVLRELVDPASVVHRLAVSLLGLRVDAV